MNLFKIIYNLFVLLEDFIFRPRYDFYSILHEFYIAAKLLGIAPFKVPHSFDCDDNQVTVTLIDKILYITFLPLIGLCSWFGFTEYIFKTNNTNSILLDIGTYLIMGVATVVVLTNMTLNLLNRRIIWNIFKNLNDIDRVLIGLHVKINYMYQYKFYMGYGFLGMGAFVAWAAFSHLPSLLLISHQYSVTLSFVRLYSYATILLTFGYFIQTLRFFRWRIQKANRFLDEFLFGYKTGRKSKLIYADCKYPDKIEMIQIYSSMFLKLNETLGLIMKIYSFRLIILCTLTYVFTLFTLFGVYRLVTSYNLEEFVLIFESVLWDCGYMFMYANVILLSVMVTNENKKTMKIVHKMINQTTDQSLIEQLLLFSKQLEQQTFDVSTNLFIFNWQFGYSTITAIAAYLILLIQFEDASKI